MHKLRIARHASAMCAIATISSTNAHTPNTEKDDKLQITIITISMFSDTSDVTFCQITLALFCKLYAIVAT